MLRSLVLAAFLLLSLLWSTTTWAAPFRGPDKVAVETDLGITASVAVTQSTVITVTTTDDEVNSDGDCSLREAIKAVDIDLAIDGCLAGEGGDTVALPPGHYLLTNGQLQLTGTITVQGSSLGTSIIDASRIDRVLYIHPGAKVTLLRLQITNGQAFPYCDSWCSITAGGAGINTAGFGGGIANYGTTLIAYSTIHGNKAGLGQYQQGGAIDGANGGGIYNEGVLTIINSTISNNSAGNGNSVYAPKGLPGCGKGGEGGGIANSGTLILEFSTVANNRPGTGNWCGSNSLNGKIGGVYSNEFFGQPRAEMYFKNSLIASNEGSDCGYRITSISHNLIQNVFGCTISGDFVHWAANLGPLQDNGGPTLTHALNKNSPVIDAGECTNSTSLTVTVDQRGEPRPQGEGCDIGAYESPYTSTFTIRDTSLPLIGSAGP